VTVGSTIRTVRGFLPDKRLTNDELEPEVGWSASEILAKTGIAERRVSAPLQCASDLAIGAAKRLLTEDGINPASIDFLIVCTQTPDHFLPATACLVHAALGLRPNCGAFDINQGCSGYIYSMAVAHGLLAANLGKRALVITADTYTKFIHLHDRSVRTLFGDGATATLVEQSDEPGLSSFILGTDGAGAGHLIVPAGGMRQPKSPSTSVASTDAQGNTRSAENLFMKGQEIFTFTLERVPQLVAGVLESAGLNVGDIDWFVFHQANRFMLEHLRKKLSIPLEKMIYFHEFTGNTVSSTIPLALEDARDRGVVQPGQKLLLAGFGVGYSWGGCLLTWPK
jgi:3-oxoacyl-[acyl-carrier-protein] synthase-3